MSRLGHCADRVGSEVMLRLIRPALLTLILIVVNDHDPV
jgi:hypothetical protein